MSRRAFSDATVLLNDLLDRLEANPSAARLYAYVDEDGFRSVRDRDRFEQVLDDASADGGIDVVRRQVDGDLQIVHVRLGEPAKLYMYLERMPAKERTDAALAALRANTDLPDEAGPLLDEIAEAWSRNVRSHGLTPGDNQSLEASLTLVAALARRVALNISDPLDFRTFCRQAGTDSKALDRLSRPVSSLLARLHPRLIASDTLDPIELLATFGVTRMPQPFLISGPISLGAEPLPDLSYYGLPSEEAAHLNLAGPVTYVLTIENYASFVRHVREQNADRHALIIYTGGFPARAHLAQIVRLAASANAPVFHWGDLDAGGARIFRHLERSLADEGVRLAPHLMAPGTLREHGEPARSERSLRAGACPESAISTLWDLIAETGLGLEQETLAPTSPVMT
jgi:hypothetical protein